jgi:hypothetical protein
MNPKNGTNWHFWKFFGKFLEIFRQGGLTKIKTDLECAGCEDACPRQLHRVMHKQHANSNHKERTMETSNNDLLPKEAGSMTGTKKELYDRLKTTMQKEAQEASSGGTRRGFLRTLVMGSGAAALGVGAFAITAHQTMAEQCDTNCEIGCLNICQTSCLANTCVASCVVPNYLV